MGELVLTEVLPASPLWDEFLELSCSYLLNFWPETVSEDNDWAFKHEYEIKLKMRIAEGGRGLFLLRKAGAIIGLANVFLTRDHGRPTRLNIAEFHIKEKHQGQGYGRTMFNLLLNWGRQKGARQVSAEVDPGLTGANAFWSRLMMHRETSNHRWRYHSEMDYYRNL
jgi:RimJ/RimL family protein N-acetyltransferase